MAKGNVEPKLLDPIKATLNDQVKNQKKALREFSEILNKKTNAALKSQIEAAEDWETLKGYLDQLKLQVSGTAEEQNQFIGNLETDFKSLFHDTAFMADSQKEVFTEVLQGYSKELKGDDSTVGGLLSQMQESLKKIDSGETKIAIDNTTTEKLKVDNKFIKETYPEFHTKYSNIFDVEKGEIKDTGTSGEFIQATKTLDADLNEIRNALITQIANQKKNIETLSESEDTSEEHVDKLTEEGDILAEMEASLAAILEMQIKAAARANKTAGVGAGTKEKLKASAGKAKSDQENKLDERMGKTAGLFDIVGQGSKSFGDQLYKASEVADGFGTALEAAGGGLESFGKAKGMFSDFTNIFRNGIFTLGAFTAAMGLAAKAIGMYHEQLDISRSMGDTNGNMVKDLQKMHINTLMDPKSLSALSSSLSANFGISLSKNQKDLEATAVKQRLSERVMGKEYADGQIEAINALKNSMTSTSTTGMMDELAAQTSTLAKTMGVSNKYALEQIKAINDNTKIIGKTMNKADKKALNKQMQAMESAWKAMGMGEEEIAAMREEMKDAFTEDGSSATLNQATMVAQMDPAILDKMASMTGAGSSKDVLDSLTTLSSAGGDLNKATMLMMKQNPGMTKDDAMKKLTSAVEATKLASQAAADKAQAEGNFEKVSSYQQGGVVGNGTATGEILNDKKVDAQKQYKSGKEEFKTRDKGESSSADLNKILVAMGATNKDDKAEAIKKLVSGLDKSQQDQIAVLEKQGYSQEDAFKSVMSDKIKEQGGNIALGKEINIGSTKIDAEKVKNVRDMDKTTLENKVGNLASTKVEITKDNVEKSATQALYTMQNAIMGLVNGAIDALNSALAWLTANIGLVTAALIGFGVAMVSLKHKDKINSVLSSVSSVVGTFGIKMTEGIAKAHVAMFNGLKGIGEKIAGPLGTAFKGIANKVGDALGPITSKLGEKFSALGEKLNFKNPFSGMKLGGGGSAGGNVKVEDPTPFWEKMKNGMKSFGSGVKGAIKGLGSGLKSMAGMVGPMILMGAATKAFEGAVEGWGKATDWFGENATFGEKIASGVGGALSALSFGLLDGEETAKSIANWFNSSGLTSFFEGLMDTMKTFWETTLKPLAKWIGSILTPIFGFMGQMFKTVFKYVQGIINVFSGLIDILIGIFTLDMSKIFGGFDSITNGFGNMLEGFYGLISGAFKAIGGILTNIPGLGWLGSAFTALGEAIDWVSSGIIAFVSNPVDMLGKAFSWIGDLFTSIKDAYVKVWTDIYNGTIGFLKNLWNTITGIFSGDLGLSDLGSLVKDTFNNIVDYIFAPIRWLADTIGGFFGVDLLKPIDGFITGVKTYFGSMVDGVMKYVGGLFDIVTAPFKAIMAWISGDLSFTDAMKQMFGSMIEGVKSMWSGFLDIVTAPFKGILSFIDSTFGTNIMGIFTSVIDSVTSIFGGFLDIVTAPFKGLIAWISGEMSLTEAFISVWENVKSALSNIWGGIKDVIMKPVQAAIDFIKSLNPFADSKEEEASKDIEAKYGFTRSMGSSDEMDSKELAKKASAMTAQEISALIKGDRIDNDNQEQLRKILQERADKGDKQAVVEVKALPAKADGGSTGGLGDAFAQMVMPDLSKETPVATVGSDEFVFSKAMIEEFMKAKGAAGSPNSGAMSLGLPSGSGDAKSAEMKSKDAQKSNLKEQKKLQEEGIKKQTKEGIDDKQATSMVDTLKSLKDKLVGGATAAGGAVVDGAKSFATGYTDVGKSILSNVGDVLTGKKNPIEAISDVGTTLMDALPDSASNIIKGLGENVTSTITNLSSIGGSITDNFKGMLNGDTTLSQGIQNVGSEINDKAITPLKDTFTSFGDKFSGLFGGLMDKVTSSPVFQKGKEIIGNVVDAGKGFMEKIAGFIHKSETGKSNGDYGAAKDIGDGAGISFGAYQLTEKSGGIKAFLDKMAADGDAKALELAKQFNKGGNAFGGNKADLTAYLKTAGNSDKGKAAQDEIYSKKYVEPAMKLAAEKGITDKAAIAQIVDHSVNAGVGGARRMLNKANGTSAEDVANARKADYNAIIAKDPSKAKYRKGWEGRVDNNSKAFKEYAGVDIGTPDKTNAKLYTSPNANVKPAIVASKDIKTQKSLNELTPNNGTTIPSSTSTKIASNNIVAKGTAQQMASTNTVNNTTNNNGSMDGKLVAQLVAINEKQLAHQTKMSQEATKQTKQGQKDYKADIDRKDQARINEISARKV